MSESQIKAMIQEFKAFRKYTATCNVIRSDEVAQFVLYKLGKATLNPKETMGESSSRGRESALKIDHPDAGISNPPPLPTNSQNKKVDP